MATTTFMEILKIWAEKAEPIELVEASNIINAAFNEFNDALNTKLLYRIRTEGLIGAVKYLKKEKDWDLRTCKEYIDKIKEIN